MIDIPRIRANDFRSFDAFQLRSAEWSIERDALWKTMLKLSADVGRALENKVEVRIWPDFKNGIQLIESECINFSPQ